MPHELSEVACQNKMSENECMLSYQIVIWDIGDASLQSKRHADNGHHCQTSVGEFCVEFSCPAACDQEKHQQVVLSKIVSNAMSKLTHAQRHEKIRNIDNRMCKPACSTMYIHVL